MKRLRLYEVGLVRDATGASYGRSLRRPEDAAECARWWIGDRDRECVVAIFRDGSGQFSGGHVVSMGDASSSIVHPREAFKASILANATGIIIAHNHPGGSLKPSSEDIQVARRIKKVGEILGIKLLDFIIVNTEAHTSFLQEGIL